VAVPTENPPGRNYAECASLLEERLAQRGLPCERIRTGDDARGDSNAAPCLSASYGSGKRTLYFHGHYDVVPAQSEEQFRPTRKEHFLFGRGTCDMKGGIVAMVYAMLALRERKIDLDGQIRLILVPDEETGGARGSAWLAKHGMLGESGIGMLTAEPTSGVVWNANRGAITLRVEVSGKSAHVGLQHKGENAFERMVCVVGRFQELKREVEERVTSSPVGLEQRRNSILLIGGTSGGGTNFNVVPERCWFTLDRRINPEEDLAEEKARIIGILEECRSEGIPLEWETLQEGFSGASKEDAEAGKALAEAIEEITGEAAAFEMCPGLLETRFYAATGVPAYAYGPGLLSVAHSPNEYVDLRKLADCAAVYAFTAKKLLAR
jgi:succinyl-diaminopimelate desuccinylase